MGIQGLLQFLKPFTEAHISQFENEFVAVDAYCWLHKSIFSCSFDLAMQKPTTLYVRYCMRYIEMLLHYNVKPILVFDGKKLSSKLETEKKRHEERQNKKQRGIQLIQAGNHEEGNRLLSESIDVTHEMAVNLMKECRDKNIDCIVAPYEADAQLAFLSLNNVVKCVITEDSDLLTYGCERVMFKMNRQGSGGLITREEIHLEKLKWNEVDADKFRYFCILCGCDYLPSLPSIGPVSALKFINMLNGRDIYEMLPRLPMQLNKLKIRVDNEYIQGFRVADNTFKYQLVYNPFLRREVPLTPTINEDDIVGDKLPADSAFQLAIGNVDPITMKTLDNFDPDESGKGFTILWEEQQLCTSKSTKRNRTSFEPQSVNSSGPSIKKYCTIPNIKSKKSTVTKTTKIPETAFLFEPSVSNNKKRGLQAVDDSKLLASRYFSGTKFRRKSQPTSECDQRKNETKEEYFQRLCDEISSEKDNIDEIDNKENSEKQSARRNSYSFSEKHPSRSNGCVSLEGFSETQPLNDCPRKFEELKRKSESSVCKSLLDKINENENECKTQKTTDSSERVVEEIRNETSSLKLSSLNGLAEINYDVLPVDDVEEEILVIEENKDENIRPSSPVFTVQKDSRMSSTKKKCEQILETTSTSTSVYFSPKTCATGTVRSLEEQKSVKSSDGNLSSKKSSKKAIRKSTNQRSVFEYFSSTGSTGKKKEDEKEK